MVAGLALNAQKTVSQDPAAQVLVKFLDHEIRERIAGILLNLLLEREPVVLDEFVENRFFRLVSGVGELFFCKVGVGHEREWWLCNWAVTMASLSDGARGDTASEDWMGPDLISKTRFG